MLAPLALALHDRSGWDVCQANRTVGFVDVLSAGATGFVSVLADVFFLDVDFNAIGNFRRYIDCRKTSLTFAFGIEGANSD